MKPKIPEETVYVVSVEVVALPGSQMAQENAGIGGFVNAVTVACDAMHAGQKVSQALAEDSYAVRKIEQITYLETNEFEDPDMQEKYLELARTALETDDVVYGEFYSYESEEDD